MCILQYHGLRNIAGNQRNVTMAAYGKWITVSIHVALRRYIPLLPPGDQSNS